MDSNTVPLVSVVANFYNSAKYIPKLIKSLLNQTFTDWELIAVNDCSPGKDLEILRKYERDPKMRGRMRIIDNKKNQGISQAKWTGIAECKGQNVTFIDGDDWFEPNALSDMVAGMETYKADVVVADYKRVFAPFYKPIIKSPIRYNTVYDKNAIKEELLKGFFGINVMSSYAYWGKMYTREILNKCGYKPRKVAAQEDTFFNLYVFKCAERIVFLDTVVYNWRWGGISSGSSKKENSFGVEGSIRNFNDFYPERLKIIRELNLKASERSLKIELYNVLRGSIGSVAAYSPEDPRTESVKALIKKSINLPSYRSVLDLKGDSYIQPEEFITRYEAQDLDWLYSFYHQIYQGNRKKRIKKKVLGLFF